MLIGISIILNRPEKKKKDVVILLILIIGILLTGSRTTFLLTLFYGIYYILKHYKSKKQRKILLSIFVVGVVFVIALVFLQQSIPVLTRLLRISLQESTLIGRILYYLDGIKLLLTHPFGLGYMGYSYVYPQVQTADYTIKFVHNDILQLGLDVGIVPMMLALFLWVRNCISKKVSTPKKELLILMFLHGLLEFNMQFIVLQLIWVMLLENSEGKVLNYKPKAKIIYATTMLIFIGIFCYFGVATYADKIGNSTLALELLPNKTSANLQRLSSMENLEEANELASEMLKNNAYVRGAYQIKANYACENAKWEEMIEYKKKAISLNHYDIAEYEEYVMMISQALEQTVKEHHIQERNYLLEQLQKVNEFIEQTKQHTNPLAYQIVDKPNLELKESTQEYLQTIKEL